MTREHCVYWAEIMPMRFYRVPTVQIPGKIPKPCQSVRFLFILTIIFTSTHCKFYHFISKCIHFDFQVAKHSNNSYYVLINDTDSMHSIKSEISCSSITKFEINSYPSEMCKCFVEIILFTFVIFMFIIVLFVVILQDSFLHWFQN